MLKSRTGKIILGGIIMLKKTFILTLIGVLLIGIFSPLFGPEILVFGPKQYTRNQGKPVTETDNFPSSITGLDFTLRVINGDDQGDHRVSSATVVLNGEQILGPSDFNQQVGVIERTVSINSNNEISVTLKSKPGSFITISIFKIYPEPTVSISAFPQTIEFGESSTLTWSTSNAHTVSIDQGIGSVDLNGSLDVSPTETTTYTLTATGYGGTATESVTVNVLVDQTPPSITINSPESGAQYDTLPISVSATYEDSGSGINQSSVKVTLNGNDITSRLTVTESSVYGEISNETFLQSGSNTLVVEVSDNAGNNGSESVQFEYQEIQEENKTIIYGRVFEAASENPLSGAIIVSSGNGGQSDGDGYWSLVFGSGGTYKIKITKDGYTEVFRKIYLDMGKEGVVEDAYLTLRDTKTTPIGPEGGTHSNTDGTVEVIIPQGALDEIKDIQATRLSSSKALPGDLNETDNLVYPISFIFCADFGPDGTAFSTPVKIRVNNSWGFAPGTEIPYAEWDKNNQKWIPQTGMATVDSSGSWLEAEVTHFSTCDINGPITSGGSHGDWYPEPYPESPVCEFGSSVNSNSGILTTEFSVPGLKLRGGDTGISFVYNSSTAYPWKAIRMIYHINSSLVDIPLRTSFSTSSALASIAGSSSGNTTIKSYTFNPPPALYGMGSLFLSGKYPSGRWINTGYQEIDFSFTHYYPGEYALVNSWGGMPVGSTGVTALEPAYYRETTIKRIFMLSRRESTFGSGWGVRGLNRLHFQGNRVVVENGSGGIIEFEKGINYADTGQGASFKSSNEQVLNPESMLIPRISQSSSHKAETRFYIDAPSADFDQTFVIDLGQEREIYNIGMDFQRYWRAFHIWDYVRISTSLDNQNWELWDQYGEPTLFTIPPTVWMGWTFVFNHP